MYDGFIKVASATPEVKVANVEFNTEKTIKCIKEAAKNGANLIVFPQLGLTSYTCGDLFLQINLIKRAENCLLKLAKDVSDLDILSVVGLPVNYQGKLYNCAAFVKNGEILGFATKDSLVNHGGLCESRYFDKLNENTTVLFGKKHVPIGPKLIFKANNYEEFSVAAEICEDLFEASSPSVRHCTNGATIVVNLSAKSEIAGINEKIKKFIEVQSEKNCSAYVYSCAGEGESTTDMVFSGKRIIAENGKIISDSKPFSTGITYAEVDLQKILQERKSSTLFYNNSDNSYRNLYFDTKIKEITLNRYFSSTPFIPEDKDILDKRCEEILNIQCFGLKKRLSHIGTKKVVIGISGGLDSTLALLVTAKTFDILNIPRKNIIAITMPSFGTTDRTYNNAKELVNHLDATLLEINIKNSVINHLSDIGADINCHDVTYENSQARERTQILMDVANKNSGIVIGTGDLSELALGFATYNGDHMSMYGVNSSIPKTLMRYIIKYVASTSDESLKNILLDIVNTPVSPELLPPDENGNTSQQTENIVGPYELHDFFIYYTIRYGFSKEKIIRIAEIAFKDIYKKEIIVKWYDIFIRRFYNNQFKRSCLPDGPMVGCVSLSPRNSWCMPSDAIVPE